MEMFANFYMERQGEYYGFLSACGRKRLCFMNSEGFYIRTGI